jgi:hypothetical protein
LTRFPRTAFYRFHLLGVLVAAAVVVPPWSWPRWTRLIIALPLAAFDVYYFGWDSSPSIIPFIPTLSSEFF